MQLPFGVCQAHFHMSKDAKAVVGKTTVACAPVLTPLERNQGVGLPTKQAVNACVLVFSREVATNACILLLRNVQADLFIRTVVEQERNDGWRTPETAHRFLGGLCTLAVHYPL